MTDQAIVNIKTSGFTVTLDGNQPVAPEYHEIQ